MDFSTEDGLNNFEAELADFMQVTQKFRQKANGASVSEAQVRASPSMSKEPGLQENSI